MLGKEHPQLLYYDDRPAPAFSRFSGVSKKGHILER